MIGKVIRFKGSGDIALIVDVRDSRIRVKYLKRTYGPIDFDFTIYLIPNSFTILTGEEVRQVMLETL